MKRKLFVSIVVVLAIILVASLFGTMTACQNASLDTQQQKIRKAFNGVAKSLSDQKAYNASAEQGGVFSLFVPTLVAEADSDGAKTDVDVLIDICDESKSVTKPEFEYDEPPMIQFQYIKSLYEKVGGAYSLGTVYKDRMTGTADFDFATGEKGKQQTYVSDVSIDIDIDANDLITVHLGLVTVYTSGAESHEQRFYAELALDYDMKKSNPTYTLTMRYVDDCSRFADEAERTNTYEYDYVNVSDGMIKEWAKAYITSPTKLVKDQSHATLDAYSENVLYAGRARAYKDGKVYFTNHTDSGDAMVNYQLRHELCTTLFDDFGLNATDIKSDDYLALDGTANDNIKKTFEDFNKIAHEDVIASFAISGAGRRYDGQPTGDGGAGNARTLDGWDNGQIEYVLGFILPAPNSASGRVNSVDVQGNSIVYSLDGFTTQEYDQWYQDTLSGMGFEASGEATLSGFTRFCAVAKDATTYYVAYNDMPNVLVIGKTDATEGENGQEQGGDKDPIGQGDKEPTNDGGDNELTGQGDKEPQGEPQQPQKVWVYFHVFDYDGEELQLAYTNPVEYTVGTTIDLAAMYIDKEVYLDPTFATLAPNTIVVDNGTTDFFVKPEDHRPTGSLNYTVVDVYADGSTEIFTTLTKSYGEEVDFCNMDYVLYADAGCTEVIDPNYTTTITEDITVYRRDYAQPGKVFLPATFYINDLNVTYVGTFAPYDFIVVQRGKLYWSDTQFGDVRFSAGKFYYDSGCAEAIFDGETYVYFDDEDSCATHVYAYLNDKTFEIVPILHNGQTVFNALYYRFDSIESVINSADLYGYGIDINDVLKFDRSGVEVSTYSRLTALETRFVYRDTVVGSTKNYFASDSVIVFEEGNNAYTDASCTQPFIYEGPINSPIIIYSRLNMIF